jgi:hypothetical protein
MNAGTPAHQARHLIPNLGDRRFRQILSHKIRPGLNIIGKAFSEFPD